MSLLISEFKYISEFIFLKIEIISSLFNERIQLGNLLEAKLEICSPCSP